MAGLLVTILDNKTTWSSEAAKINYNFQLLQAAINSIVPPELTAIVNTINNQSPLDGNIDVTLESLGGVPLSMLDAPSGIPVLDSNEIIQSKNLPDSLKEGVLYKSIASTATQPLDLPGFYIATEQGTYTHFNSLASTPIEVTANDLKGNVVIFYRSQSQNYWNKQLIPVFSPDGQVIDWSNITNKPSFANVAYTGDYSSLINTPALAQVATTGQFSDLLGTEDVLTSQDKNVSNGVAGLDLQGKLEDTVIPESLKNSVGAIWAGKASPATNPYSLESQTTSKLFYLLTQQGAYPYFSNLTINSYEWAHNICCVAGREGVWQKVLIPVRVTSVNGKIGDVSISAVDMGAIPVSDIGVTVPPLEGSKIPGDYLPALSISSSQTPQAFSISVISSFLQQTTYGNILIKDGNGTDLPVYYYQVDPFTQSTITNQDSEFYVSASSLSQDAIDSLVQDVLSIDIYNLNSSVNSYNYYSPLSSNFPSSLTQAGRIYLPSVLSAIILALKQTASPVKWSDIDEYIPQN